MVVVCIPLLIQSLTPVKSPRQLFYFIYLCSVQFNLMEMASSSVARQNQSQLENIFDELAPFSAPKSTEPWDVFINHCGRDVKHTLATTIYHKLHSIGLHVFLDLEALEAGDSIPAEIQHAIASATLQIAIFSPTYAQSPWCLAELSSMLKTGATIIPIFYHIEPSDLRWIESGKGKYADAFSEHEKKGRYTPEKLNVWRRALRDSSFISGYTINNNKDEATVLKNIVNCTFQIMKKVPLWVAEHPLGLDELIQGFESVAGEEKVKIMGIAGIGGSGKTTLAKELFNRNFSSFERCSFVFDVRDAASRNALSDKQKKLLADLGVHDLPFDSVDEGKIILANRLSSHRALIVLDDVDHIDQLNALLPNKDNLGSQSMVIVTTRELGVLKSWGISSIYKMPGLSMPHAGQLFCWHAFLQPFPPPGFEVLVQKFLKACNSLPLSLKVLGAQLYGKKSRDYWKSQLNKILRILPGEIKERLQVSYDALDEEEREMFLDVACFLTGEKKSKAVAVWDGSGWSGLHGIETLLNKCLVELFDGDKRIRMHDHLRDIGREIASRHSPYRVWFTEQIVNMKKHSMKIKLLRGIQPADSFVAFKEYRLQFMGISRRSSKRLRFSNGLQILSVKGNEFTEEFAPLSEDLVWLRWEGFPLRSLPSWLTLKNLSVLELHKADELEELWKDNVEPPLQLRELILLGCQKLQWLPSSIRSLRYLKRLVVYFHGSSLPEELCDLQSLEYVRLYSPVLSSLPTAFGNLISLKKIELRNCEQLNILPDSFNQLIHLKDLNMISCQMLSSLPIDFGNLISLWNVDLWYCKQLSTLPDSFSQLIHLQILNLTGCEMLCSLPVGFGNLTSLRNVSLGNCKKLSTLPDSFSQLIYLEFLNLSGCEMLSSLPVSFGNLIRLQSINIGSCIQLNTLPDSFKQLTNLMSLNLSNCKMLFSLPTGFGNLICLQNINLKSCIQLRTLPDSFKQLINLEDLNLSGCAKLELRSDIMENIRKLKVLNLSDCKELEDLPHQIIYQESLTKLYLQGCIKLRAVPTNISKLSKLDLLTIETLVWKSFQTSLVNSSSLKSIEILSSGSKIDSNARAASSLKTLKEPDIEDCKQFSTISISNETFPILETFVVRMNHYFVEIETLPVSLKILEIYSCNLLKNITCIKDLVNLEVLTICDCLQIEELSSFADLVSLKEFRIRNCPKIEKMEGLEHSKSLKVLIVQTCWKVPGIQSLEKVERLEELELKCDTISALKPCIQSIQGCPRKIWIQGRVIRLVKPIVNSLEFPDLAVREVEELPDVDKILDECDFNALLCYAEEIDEERKVVHIYVVNTCPYDYQKNLAKSFFRIIEGNLQGKKAMLVMGKEGRVVEAFYQLLEFLEG
ncbi:disease resistance protein TAO1 isoform X2 [Cryptomeria japonica]|uniref:disease resistance protein TAO1 isoform X2 n=1 Tax=Cryptomeria japonica TaxID=3369 RepID=UPI0027DA3C18|nr:disease resistance protein TAO1 isoform X2 [Cryptomeria japonica]